MHLDPDVHVYDVFFLISINFTHKRLFLDADADSETQMELRFMVVKIRPHPAILTVNTSCIQARVRPRSPRQGWRALNTSDRQIHPLLCVWSVRGVCPQPCKYLSHGYPWNFNEVWLRVINSAEWGVAQWHEWHFVILRLGYFISKHFSLLSCIDSHFPASCLPCLILFCSSLHLHCTYKFWWCLFFCTFYPATHMSVCVGLCARMCVCSVQPHQGDRATP